MQLLAVRYWHWRWLLAPEYQSGESISIRSQWITEGMISVNYSAGGLIAFSVWYWLGIRKSFWPVKNWVLAWLSVRSEVQICIQSRWCHCRSIIPCFIQIQIGFNLSGAGLPRLSWKKATKWVSVWFCWLVSGRAWPATYKFCAIRHLWGSEGNCLIQLHVENGHLTDVLLFIH